MSSLRALIVDGDRGFADRLRGWLSAYDLEVVVSAEWNDELPATVEPNVVFIAIDDPDEAGLSACERARAAWPGARIVLAGGTIPLEEMNLYGAQAGLDKRTLTPQELHVHLDALIGPLLGVDAEGGHTTAEGPGGRVAELEEEARRLRWELDETRRAAQSAPYSRDFMRMSEVVSSKEKDIVRLKKEISARDHRIATAQRTQREASARAVVATREREAAVGHAAQLQRDFEVEQAEARRLRLEVQRQAAEAEQALASLIDERQQHDETRRQHEIALAANAEALKAAKDDQLRSRSALETQLREEKDQAVAAVSAEWKGKFERLRRRRARSLSILHDRLGEVKAAHEQELAAAQAEAEGRRIEELEAARTAAERQREEVQRLHELALAGALAAHADAEKRAEQHRSAWTATEARLHEEKVRALDAATAEWQVELDQLRRAHADSVDALRRHFLEQLGGVQAAQEQGWAKRDDASEAALRGVTEELLAARSQAARLETEARQRHEEELAQAQARDLQALTALETRLREEKEQALAASASEWEGTLDQLRRAHADSVDALRRQHLDQLGTLRDSGEQELARREDQHDAALRGLQAAHLEALTLLETRLREEKEQAIAASDRAWGEKLEELRRQHFEALDTLRGEHRDEVASLHASRERAAAERDVAYQAALRRAAEQREALAADAERQRADLVRLHELAQSEAEAGHVEAMRLAEQDHRSAQRAIEERLREEQARAVAALTADWEGKLDELRGGHASSLEALRQHFQDQFDELRASAAQELGQRDGEHQAVLHRAIEDLASARMEAAQLDQETRQRYEQELVRAETRHVEALGALEAHQREERDRAVAATITAWEGRLEELRVAHAASVDALRREHQDQITALRAAREQELLKEDEEYEAALRRLGEELAAARSKAAQPGPAQLVARHAEAIKAVETRLREEKDQAVAAAVAEWKAKMERLRRGHADAMAALRREHEDQLMALARQEGLAARPSPDPNGKVVPLKAVNRDRSS